MAARKYAGMKLTGICVAGNPGPTSPSIFACNVTVKTSVGAIVAAGANFRLVDPAGAIAVVLMAPPTKSVAVYARTLSPIACQERETVLPSYSALRTTGCDVPSLRIAEEGPLVVTPPDVAVTDTDTALTTFAVSAADKVQVATLTGGTAEGVPLLNVRLNVSV